MDEVQSLLRPRNQVTDEFFNVKVLDFSISLSDSTVSEDTVVWVTRKRGKT